MTYDPQPGDVIRYDFLWTEEQQRGQQAGTKDRPCAIVLATKPAVDGSKRLLLAPITHTPPSLKGKGIEVPPKVARHLGLDDERSWIKTHQVNVLTWQKGQIPYGVTPAKKGSWTYGRLPHSLSKRVFDEIRERSQKREVKRVDRDEERDRRR